MGSTVKDVMTTQVVAVRKAASFKEMAVKMRDSRIGAFPVLDDGGRVIGVVSAADMLNKEADLATGPEPLSSLLRFGDREKAAGVTAAELMTSPPVTLGPDAPVAVDADIHGAFALDTGKPAGGERAITPVGHYALPG